MDEASERYRECASYAYRSYLTRVARSRHVQEDVRAAVIRMNQSSEFGMAHKFGLVRTYQDYVARVPIRSYQEMEPWTSRAAAGEHPVLTSDRPVLFHRTSGTTGAAKQIPVTRSSAFTRFRNAPAHVASLLRHHPEVLEDDDAVLALTENPPVASTTSGGLPWCFFSETDWSRLGLARHPGGPGARAPWRRIPCEVSEAHYYRLRYAAERSLRGILAWFPASVLQLRTRLIEWGERLVRDVHDGTVAGRALCEPNPRRASEVQAALALGAKMALRDVWPRLTVVECWTTSTSSAYLKQLRAQLGQGVEIFPAGYGCTETSIAFVVDPNVPPLLDVTGAFFEFVPAESPHDPPLRHHELERGLEYGLVLTTVGGLYRYALGDIVRVHGQIGDVPLIEFSHRRGVAVSLIAEKMSELQIATAIRTAVAGTACEEADASVSPAYEALPHYILLLEAEVNRRDVVSAVVATFDRALAANVNYAFYRSTGLVGPPTVELLTPGTFAEWRREEAANGRGAPSQQKHRLVCAPEEIESVRSTSRRLGTASDVLRRPCVES